MKPWARSVVCCLTAIIGPSWIEPGVPVILCGANDYSCSMWGGDVESEYAWIFGDTELALVGLQPETPGGPRPLAILEPSEPTRVVTGDVLVSTLKHLSLDLPTAFFAPHTRAFPWAKYKLAGRHA